MTPWGCFGAKILDEAIETSFALNRLRPDGIWRQYGHQGDHLDAIITDGWQAEIRTGLIGEPIAFFNGQNQLLFGKAAYFLPQPVNMRF